MQKEYEWQAVIHNNKKRIHSHEPTDTKYWLSNPVPTNNRYDELTVDDGMKQGKETNNNNESKPPSIFVSRIKTITPLIEMLESLAKDCLYP